MQKPKASKRLLFVAAAIVSVLVSGQTYAASNGVIAYSARDASDHQNIFFINPDGTGKVQITFGPDNGLPSWSPDGKQLAFVYIDGNISITICTMNSDGTNIHGVIGGFTPMWSPDGTRIAYAAPSRTSTPEIWTMKPDGTGKLQLTNTPGYNKVHPTWSPDGKYIAYVQYDRSGVPNVWTMTSSGTNQKQLTTGSWFNRDSTGKIINTANASNSPDWSPGNKIVFWAGIEGQAGQVWTINSDGTSRTQLTTDPSSNDDPEWSPDGTKILFSTSRNPGNPEMWVMNADGTQQQKITDNTGGPLPADAAWQPIP
jgi:Tol biopolymer transport system component